VTAQILLHPKLPQVVSLIDVVRKFNALGYALSNTKARNIEAVSAVTTVVPERAPARAGHIQLRRQTAVSAVARQPFARVLHAAYVFEPSSGIPGRNDQNLPQLLTKRPSS
jgi:hypothetical protein